MMLTSAICIEHKATGIKIFTKVYYILFKKLVDTIWKRLLRDVTIEVF